MEKEFVLDIKSMSGAEKTCVKELSDLVKSVGVRVKLIELDGGSTFVKFNYDTKEVTRKTTRNAGAPQKHLKNSVRVPVAEIRDRMSAGETAEEISAGYGISRRTLFRKLERAEELGLDYII